MYDELVKRLKEVEEMLKVSQFKEATNLIDQAADAIEELSRLYEAQRQNLITLMNEAPEMERIPLSERLPEEET